MNALKNLEKVPTTQILIIKLWLLYISKTKKFSSSNFLISLIKLSNFLPTFNNYINCYTYPLSNNSIRIFSKC